MKVALASFSGRPPFFDSLIPDLGLAQLAAVLAAAGIDHRVFDLNRIERSFGDSLAEIRAYRPDIMGFKFFDTGFAAVESLAQEVRRELPQCTIVGGGPHVSLFQETVIEVSDAFDVIVYGEGEGAILDLVEWREGRRDLSDVRGAIYRGTGGEVFKNPQDLLTDLDALPLPRWEVFDLERYLPIAMLNAFRGCPYTCSFCAHNRAWGYQETGSSYRPLVRRRSAASVVREIESDRTRYGLRLFGFADSTPIPGLWLDLAEHFAACSPSVWWTSFAYVGHFGAGDFDLLAKSGCAALWFGIESGSRQLRERMGKTFSDQEVLETFAWATSRGIVPIPGFIVGFPGETAETLAETKALASQLRDAGAPVVVISPYILDPGTPVSLAPTAYGVRPYPDWQRRIVRRQGLNEFEVDYYEVDGVSNVEKWRSHYQDSGYPGWEQDRNIAESEFAYLLARATGMDSGEIVAELDSSLKRMDTRALHRFLSLIWERVR